MKTTADAAPPLYVSKISVSRLFGRYTYELDPIAEPSKLLILYGENGTGKTTLLWMVYHLLSKRGDGHKTFLARTPFQRLCVSLGGQTDIIAERAAGVIEGTYTMAVVDIPSGDRHEFEMKADESGAIRVKTDEEERAFSEFLMLVPDLKLSFLPDTRRTTPFFEEGDEPEDEELISVRRHALMEERRLRAMRTEEDPPGRS